MSTTSVLAPPAAGTMQFSLRTLLLFVTVEALLAGSSGAKFIILQPVLFFAYCMARGMKYCRTHSLAASLKRGFMFAVTGYAAMMLFGGAALAFVAIHPWGPDSTSTLLNLQPVEIVLVAGTVVVMLSMCGVAAYVIGLFKWSVAAHLACPCMWLLLIWPEALQHVLKPGGHEITLGALAALAAFMYLPAAMFFTGGLLGTRRKERREKAKHDPSLARKMDREQSQQDLLVF